MMKRVFSPKTSLALAAMLAIGVAPLAGWAKKAEPTYKSNDTTYQYVSTVFEKLQSHWEKQPYDQRLQANATLTFVLNDEGQLAASDLAAATNDNGSGKEALAFLKQSPTFGQFPKDLDGDQLEFKFKLTPGSLEMVSYRLLEDRKRKDSVISFNAPSSPGPAAASLFYARVVDTVESPRVGKVWENSAVQTTSEQAQAGSEQVMDEYIATIQDRIQQKWKQPGEEVNFAPTVALIQIDRDGSLLSAYVKQSSGSKAIDKAIVNTITQAAPFNRVPDVAQSLPVTIEYVFEPVVSTVFEENI